MLSHSLLALMMFQALLFTAAVMMVIWALSLRLKNAGIVDIAWAGLFAPVAILYAVIGDGDSWRRGVLALMVSIWSARLAVYLFIRVRSHHPAEDARYAKMRDAWSPVAETKFLYFFQLQGVLLVFLTFPFAVACLNPAPALSRLEIAACLLWVIAVTGESLADRQLDHFKHAPENRGKTCDFGLWKYSRHPNYFFEWLIWVSYFLFAVGSQWGWVSIYCPLLMYFVLTKVTGIPLAEEQSLKSRGDEYRNYQHRTSEFFPWFPKKS